MSIAPVVAQEAYQKLQRRFHEIAVLGDAQGILSWDSQTQMPVGAAEGRAEQEALLAVLQHERLTDPCVGDWLAAVAADPAGIVPESENAESLGWHQANIAEMRRAYIEATAVPAELVAATSKAASRAEVIWRTARNANDYPALRPALAEVLRCQRETGAALGAALSLAPYDALLGQYEPGMTTARIDIIFNDLAASLPDLLARVLERQQAQPPVVRPEGPFAIAQQEALGRELMAAIGFDFQRGRLDVSLHPFCGGATGDVRITTRYTDSDFAPALMGVLHETGHAVYEQNRPAAWRGQPVGQARSMGVHESQSLLMEMQACRSRDFITWLAPRLRERFGGRGPAWEVDNLCRLYTEVKPDFIRVDADEVTYPAHVILRYRLERDMIAGSLDLADLPEAWNLGMQTLLGITPPDDRRGCLQDIHWPSGGWGYFPTYTLGAMMAAQIFAAACTADGDIRPGLAQGDFIPLTTWLHTHIHSQARRWSSDELLARATGTPLHAEAYRRHLERRYLGDV